MIRTTSFRTLALAHIALGLFIGSISAQSDKRSMPVHEKHQYSAYEQMIFKNVSQFHMNFNNRSFAKNGDLVVRDLQVDSNGTEVLGREAFVQRIARFVGPFPDVKIDDESIVVDGNTAVIRFVITGTQKGDLEMGGTVIKATNKSIRVDGAEIFTFDKDGKCTDLVTIENMAQLLAQLRQ